MTIKNNQNKAGLGEWRLVAFGLLLALTGFASVAEAIYSLPASRSVKWEGNVGVQGDIPARTAIYKTLSPSGGNDTSAIQTAISACPSGQVVKLNAGTFNISSPINVKSGVTLRGAGMGATIIKGISGMSGAYVIGFNAGSSLGGSVNITAGSSKGSSTITTGSAHGWKVGDIILIDQLNDAGGNPVVTNVGSNGTCTWCGRNSGTRSLGQVSKVVAVPSSTTATLEIPLYWNYTSGRSVQGTKINGITASAGIEHLTIDNLASGSSRQASDGGTIAAYGTSNCWLLGVEAIGSYTNMVRMKRSYRDTIRGCKFHEGTPALPATGSQYNTSRAYCLYMSPASACLVENTQIYHLTMATKLDGPASGNVFAYNTVAAMYYAPSASWQVDNFRMHGGHPMMNLFEGNVLLGRTIADVVWGSSSHNTYFRNRNALDPARTSSAYNYALYKNASYYNIIGNVIGTAGFENVYSTNIGSSSKVVYAIDSGTQTTMQHGNWDSVTNSITWNSADDRTLPASLYLSSKPNWWGSMQWPAIGPDVSPRYPAAKALGTGTPWGSLTTPRLSAPASLVAN